MKAQTITLRPVDIARLAAITEHMAERGLLVGRATVSQVTRYALELAYVLILKEGAAGTTAAAARPATAGQPDNRGGAAGAPDAWTAGPLHKPTQQGGRWLRDDVRPVKP